MPTTPINGVKINWELDGGAGEPIVLVHGSWGDHHNWAPVVPAFSRSFRVLTYDRRGHSGSERSDGQGSVWEDVADLAALVEHLEHFPAHIIGNSFGASIVLRLAGERPELFRSLIVHEPPLFGLLKDEPNAQSVLVAVQQRMGAVVELLTAGDFAGGARQFVETVAFGPGAWESLPQATRDTFVFNAPTWLDEVRDPDALEIDIGRLRQFSAPALLTVGGQSPPFFPVVVERIAGALAQAERHTFAEAGHVPHLSHSEEHIRVVAGFIQGAAVLRVGS
jgi:pimeloyl-ACP methyl ester carboxylesterase